MELSGVVVAWHGLALDHNEAMGARKVFEYLPGLRHTITKIKNGGQSPTTNILYFTVYSDINRVGGMGGTLLIIMAFVPHFSFWAPI